MASSKEAKRIEGIVQPCFLDSICLSHRVCVVATDGRVFEVEPNYLGLYLERFTGQQVVARVVPVTTGVRRSVVRILSLKVLGMALQDGPAATESVNGLHGDEDQGQIVRELEIGATAS